MLRDRAVGARRLETIAAHRVVERSVRAARRSLSQLPAGMVKDIVQSTAAVRDSRTLGFLCDLRELIRVSACDATVRLRHDRRRVQLRAVRARRLNLARVVAQPMAVERVRVSKCVYVLLQCWADALFTEDATLRCLGLRGLCQHRARLVLA